MTMSANISIRQATRNDLRAIASVEQEIFSDPWSTQDILRLLNSRKSEIWLAFHRATPIGIVTLRRSDSYVLLMSLGVVKQWRRKGVGRRLVSVVKDIARKENKRIRAYIPETNLATQVFLRSCEFLAVGITSGEEIGRSAKESVYIMEHRLGKHGTVAMPRHRLREYFANLENRGLSA